MVKSVRQVIRSILMLTQTLDPLPDGRYLTMKLHFWDDVTPLQYQPPLFKEGTSLQEQMRVVDAGDGVAKWKIGAVDSVHHRIAVKMATAVGGAVAAAPAAEKPPPVTGEQAGAVETAGGNGEKVDDDEVE